MQSSSARINFTDVHRIAFPDFVVRVCQAGDPSDTSQVESVKSSRHFRWIFLGADVRTTEGEVF